MLYVTLCARFLTSSQGLTEPNHGSDPAGMETTAEEVDGGFLLNGAKTWISNAPVASVKSYSMEPMGSCLSDFCIKLETYSSYGPVASGTRRSEGFLSKRSGSNLPLLQQIFESFPRKPKVFLLKPSKTNSHCAVL